MKRWVNIEPSYLEFTPPLIHRVCKQSKTTGDTSEAGTAHHSGAPEFIPVFSGLRVTRSLDFCVVFRRSLLVPLCPFFWLLCCLFFYDIRLLITSLWYLQTFSYPRSAVCSLNAMLLLYLLKCMYSCVQHNYISDNVRAGCY